MSLHKTPILHRGRIDAALRAFSLFFMISAPSIKLLYPSSAINGISASILFIAFLVHYYMFDSKFNIKIFLWWTLFCGLLTLSGLLSYGNVETASRYALMMFSIYIVIMISDDDVVPLFCHFIFFWGLVVAIWQIAGGVPTDRALGQTYLTVSMPIGAAMAYAATSVMRGDTSFSRRLFYAFAVVVMIYSMSTLLGRAALLFSALSFFIATGIFVLLMPSSAAKKMGILAATVATLFMATLAAMAFGLRQMGRLTNLFENIQNEPRMEIYADAFQYIYINPILGYGFGSSSKLFEVYPHNIFLEVMLHGGIFLFIVFLFLFIFFFRSIISLARNSSGIGVYTALLSVSIFFLFQWNVSFDFATSYIPLGCVLLFVISAERLQSKSKNECIGG